MNPIPTLEALEEPAPECVEMHCLGAITTHQVGDTICSWAYYGEELLPKQEAIRAVLTDQDAFVNWFHWEWPLGPWGWEPDGTSTAPTQFLRQVHLTWYEEVLRMHPELTL